MWILTGLLVGATVLDTFGRYEQLRTGCSWDLGYYNQWFWALTRGDRQITVRPSSAYAMEGPSVWRSNHLAPIRLAILPAYAIFPDPRTLLVVQALVFWCVLPVAYVLVRAESGSTAVALAATMLVPLTPLAWPLAVNDFRELQLAVPFVLLAIHGWRERLAVRTACAIAGLLACRQELALLVLCLPIVPPRLPDAPGRRRTWTMAALAIGGAWAVLFLGYLQTYLAPHAIATYASQFTRPSSTSLAQMLDRSARLLWFGLGSWSLLALGAPRVALLAVPWISVLGVRWDLDVIATSGWHHVRYAAPVAALILAAGLLGVARLAHALGGYPRSRLVVAYAAVTVALLIPTRAVHDRLSRVPVVVAPTEAARLQGLFAQVASGDGVLADYEVVAPLSSRRAVFDYVRVENQPPGYPRLAPEIRWAFVRTHDAPVTTLRAQGFRQVHDGAVFKVFAR